LDISPILATRLRGENQLIDTLYFLEEKIQANRVFFQRFANKIKAVGSSSTIRLRHALPRQVAAPIADELQKRGSLKSNSGLTRRGITLCFVADAEV
jgi:hypothetical protein